MTTMQRIIVGGDHTPAASAALRWAVAQAAGSGAYVCVVHAFDVAGRADLALERDLDRARRDSRYRTQSWVVEVLGETAGSVPVTVSTPDGSVVGALVAAAHDASMVVIGRPRSRHNRRLAERVARSCACPVVTIGADAEIVASVDGGAQSAGGLEHSRQRGRQQREQVLA
ncbi:MAG TPA: universal stress protein [Nocardioidaceae bacterium]|jgi:nucleotide-binding universal stress UspA family protein|nr:universal stress protein [Nocardioidaceae bacterium]